MEITREILILLGIPSCVVFSMTIVILQMRKKLLAAREEVKILTNAWRARDFLLERLTSSLNLHTIRISTTDDWYGVAKVYRKPGEEPEILECAKDPNGNYHQYYSR